MTTLTYFYSPDCHVCKETGPEVKKFSQDHNITIKKVNVETAEGSRLADKVGIEAVPHIIIKDFKCEKNIVGQATKKQLDYALEKSCDQLKGSEFEVK